MEKKVIRSKDLTPSELMILSRNGFEVELDGDSHDPVQAEVDYEYAVEQLQRIEERLAKLEGMLHELMVRDNQPITPIMQQPQQTFQTPVMESINTPPKGSMLSEIQNVIAQQEAAAGSMGQMGGDIVSSVATMSPAAYDDDVPNIIGLD